MVYLAVAASSVTGVFQKCMTERNVGLRALSLCYQLIYKAECWKPYWSIRQNVENHTRIHLFPVMTLSWPFYTTALADVDSSWLLLVAMHSLRIANVKFLDSSPHHRHQLSKKKCFGLLRHRGMFTPVQNVTECYWGLTIGAMNMWIGGGCLTLLLHVHNWFFLMCVFWAVWTVRENEICNFCSEYVSCVSLIRTLEAWIDRLWTSDILWMMNMEDQLWYMHKQLVILEAMLWSLLLSTLLLQSRN